MGSSFLYIFDLDGTLIDSETLIAECYLEALRARNLRMGSEGFSEKIRGKHVTNFMRELFPDISEETILDIRSEKNRLYLLKLSSLQINHGLVQLAEQLKLNGTVALATTASREAANAIINHFGWTHLFEVVVTGDDVISRKPSPECFEKVLDLLSFSREQAIVFEDSDVGLEAARRAGLKCVRVSSKF